MDHLRHQNYKSEHIEMEYFNIIRKNRILKAKNSLLVFRIDLGELKDREIKIRKEVEELFL